MRMNININTNIYIYIDIVHLFNLLSQKRLPTTMKRSSKLSSFKLFCNEKRILCILNEVHYFM